MRLNVGPDRAQERQSPRHPRLGDHLDVRHGDPGVQASPAEVVDAPRGPSCHHNTLTHLLTHLLTRSLTCLFTHSLAHSLTYSLTYLLTYLFFKSPQCTSPLSVRARGARGPRMSLRRVERHRRAHQLSSQSCVLPWSLGSERPAKLEWSTGLKVTMKQVLTWAPQVWPDLPPRARIRAKSVQPAPFDAAELTVGMK